MSDVWIAGRKKPTLPIGYRRIVRSRSFCSIIMTILTPSGCSVVILTVGYCGGARCSGVKPATTGFRSAELRNANEHKKLVVLFECNLGGCASKTTRVVIHDIYVRKYGYYVTILKGRAYSADNEQKSLESDFFIHLFETFSHKLPELFT
jgi:hypothetical protein